MMSLHSLPKKWEDFRRKHLQLLRTAASALEQHSHQVAWAIYERLSGNGDAR